TMMSPYMNTTDSNESASQLEVPSAENLQVLEYFKKKRGGFFVEVGANEPRKLSQTWLLEQNGWSGVLIEPQSACCRKLREERPAATVFQVACCAPEQKGTLSLNICGHSALSGIQKHAIDIDVHYAPTETVEALPLDEVLAQAGSP